MHQKFILKQKFNSKLLNYHSLTKYKKVISNMDSLTGQFHWMFDYYRNSFYYLTERTLLFPKRENAFVPGMGYQCLIDNTHPDDVAYLLEIQKKAFQFIFKQKIENRQNCKFAFKLRLLTKRNDYIPYIFKIKIAEIDNLGNLWISMANGVPSHSDNFFHPLIISTLDDSVLDIPEVKHPKLEYSYPDLTPMEIKIIRYMGLNKSAEEICEMLQFTANTCKKHKTNLFKKLNTTNTVVAIENARLLGILDSKFEMLKC